MGKNEQRALCITLVVLGFATLALGSAPRWATCASSMLAIASALPLLGSRRRLASVGPVLLLAIIATTATFLQLVPLPAEVVEFISPSRFALSRDNAAAYGATPEVFLPLSYDWPATLVELVKFVGYFAFAYTCSRLANSRRARFWIHAMIAGVASLVGLCAIMHRLVGAETLLGLYSPAALYRQSLSPFLNPNHLAGYMAFAGPICLGLAAQRRSPMFAVAGLFCSAVALQAVSRAGLISCVVGVTVTLGLLLYQNRHSRERRKRYLPFVPLFVLAFVGLIFIVGASAAGELLALDLATERASGKLLAWTAAPRLIESVPWIGIGRGSFEFAFTAFQPTAGVTYSHIENEYLQAVIDWGIPVALLLSAGFTWLLLKLVKSRGGPLSAGALGGLAAILIHNFMDFGLELPGIAFPVIAVACSLVPAKLKLTVPGSARRKWTRVTLASGALGICVLGLSLAERERGETIAKASQQGADAETLLALGAELSQRHPSDYLVPAQVTRALWHLRDPKVIGVLNRALALNPLHPGIHHLAARVVSSSQNPRQALGEYRATLKGPGFNRQVLQELVARFPDHKDIAHAIPRTRYALSYGQALLSMGRADAAEEIAKLEIPALNEETELAMARLRVESTFKNGRHDEALRMATEFDRTKPSTESLALYVQILRQLERPLEARELLEKRLYRLAKLRKTEHLALYLELAILQRELRSLDEARKTLQLVLTAATNSRRYRYKAHLEFATLEQQAGNLNQADWHRSQALQNR